MVKSDSGVPYLYGQDDVHGVNYCLDAVIFPHNIGMGVAKVLCGDADFTGKLPSPWYADDKGIETHSPWLEYGYGLTY